MRSFGENKPLLLHFQTDFIEIFRVIADTLHVVQNVEIRTNLLFLRSVYKRGKLDKIFRKRIVCKIDDPLALFNFSGILFRIARHCRKGFFQILSCQRDHIFHFFLHLHHRNRRGCEQAFVHVTELSLLHFHLLILDDKHRKLHELFDKRQQNERRRHVKDYVEPCKLHLCASGDHLQKPDGLAAQRPKQRRKQYRTDHIKG